MQAVVRGLEVVDAFLVGDMDRMTDAINEADNQTRLVLALVLIAKRMTIQAAQALDAAPEIVWKAMKVSTLDYLDDEAGNIQAASHG